MRWLCLVVCWGVFVSHFGACVFLFDDNDRIRPLPLPSRDPTISKEKKNGEASGILAQGILRRRRDAVSPSYSEDAKERPNLSTEGGTVNHSVSASYFGKEKILDTLTVKGRIMDFNVQPSHPEVASTRRIKRSGMDFFASPDCPVHETEPGQDLARIVSTQRSEYMFFFKPLSGFRSLVFRMIVNNRLDFSGSYEWPRKSLVIHGYELHEDTFGENGWVPVNVEYYRHRVVGTDKLGLRVSVGTAGNQLTKTLIARNRWTHEYDGFNAYVEGKAEYSFNCYPSEDLPRTTVHIPHSQMFTTPQSTAIPSPVPSEVTEESVMMKNSEVNLSASHIPPEEMRELNPRSGIDFFASSNCTVHETQPNQGLTKIVGSSRSEYSFFFKPLQGFKNLKFRMIVDNKFDMGGSYEWTEQSLVVHGYELGEGTVGGEGWMPVKVEYYRHRVPSAPDSLALRVFVGKTGNLIRNLTTRNRWTYRYSGFAAYVEGRAKYSFDCYPSNVTPASSSVRYHHSQEDNIMLGGVLGGAVLLVLGILVIALLVRKRNHNQPPPVPKQLPMKMLLRRTQVRSEPEPTYEEFDEETLARLRRKLDPHTLGCYDEERSVLDAPHNTKSKGKGFQGPCESGVDVNWRDEGGAYGGVGNGDKDTRAPDNTYENEGTLRLLREKERVWKEEPKLGQKPEDHYVEMHGIVSRTNSLNK